MERFVRFLHFYFYLNLIHQLLNYYISGCQANKKDFVDRFYTEERYKINSSHRVSVAKGGGVKP